VSPNRFDNMPPRYNIAPTQEVAAVRLNAEKQRELVMLRWGLIPYRAKDVKIAFSTINAMSESVSEKPAFREAFTKRRCLVLADGFYEWQPTGAKTKQPYLIRMLDQQPFAFAGLGALAR
jgi:putative SOS response-associated peptidase YedK